MSKHNDLDPYMSLFFNRSNELNLFDVFPNLKLDKIFLNKTPIICQGPYSPQYPPEEIHKYFGSTISTYPHYSYSMQREGSPLCDSYRLHVYDNVIIACLTDGCSWGERPKEAANRAKDNFVEHVIKLITSVKTLHDIGPLLMSSLGVAHKSIMEGKNEIWMSGTTTLLGGACVPIKNATHKWAFCAVTIGDCKALHWSMKDKALKDLTIGNRQNLCDPRDPGGRIGPYIKSGEPDLRNLKLFWTPCDKDDIIIILSDGVHDNFDPQVLGITPEELGIEKNWEDFSLEDGIKIKTEYFLSIVSKIIYNKEIVLTPKLITKRILEHCMDITNSSRQYMEQNPQFALEHDYKKYPGKMDHTTCLSFQVGNLNVAEDLENEKDLHETTNPEVWPF